MTQLTKAQLVAQLEAAHVSYATLVAKYEALQGDHEELTRDWAALREERAELRTAALRVDPALSPYRQALAAAKAQAMRSGMCVSVAAR